MDKKMLRELCIEWFEDVNNLNKAFKFMFYWIKYKSPNTTDDKIKEFINKVYHSIHNPFSQNNWGMEIIHKLQVLSRIDLEICYIVETNNYNHIIKIY